MAMTTVMTTVKTDTNRMAETSSIEEKITNNVNKLNFAIFGMIGVLSMLCRHLYRFETNEMPKYLQRIRLKKEIQENCPLNTLYRFQKKSLLVSIQEMQVRIPLANVCRLLLGTAQPWYYRFLFGIKKIGATDDEDNWHIIGKMIKIGIASDKEEEETKDVYIPAFHHLLTLIDIDATEPRHREMIVWAACLLLELMNAIALSTSVKTMTPPSLTMPPLTDRAKANLTNIRSSFVTGMIVLHRYENISKGHIVHGITTPQINPDLTAKPKTTSKYFEDDNDDDIVWV